ncbi:hypothetical protein [Candidatus Vampirococcus lugosii]|nr:hypothetical protein [Candidatus Vampirococcus lugosii]
MFIPFLRIFYIRELFYDFSISLYNFYNIGFFDNIEKEFIKNNEEKNKEKEKVDFNSELDELKNKII